MTINKPFSFTIILIITNILYISSVKAQTSNLRFTHFTIRDGLSTNIINEVFQDRDGFLWIGTHDGLFSYDGHQFTAFYHDEKKQNTICGNIVYSIKETKDNRLLIGTDGGLSVFNKKNKTFQTIDSARNNATEYVNNVLISRDNKIYTSCKSAVKCFDADLHLLYSLTGDTLNKEPMWTSELSFNGIIENNDGTIWMATPYGGLQVLNPATKEVFHFRHNPHNIEALNQRKGAKTVCANSIIKDHAGNIWFNNWDKGLFCYNPSKNQTLSYREILENSLSKGLVNTDWLKTTNIQNQVICLFEDSKNNIWVGTTCFGLWCITPATGKVFYYFNNAADPNSISDNRITHITEDRQGNIWVATENGLNLVNCFSQQFSIVSNEFKNQKGEKPIINNGVFGADKTVWISSYGMGLFNYNPETGELKNYLNPVGNKDEDGIWALKEEDNHQLWLSTQDGAFVFDMEKKKFQYPAFFPDSIRKLLDNEPVTCFLKDAYGDYWWTTAHKGVLRYIASQKKFINYNKDNNPHGLNFRGFYMVKEDAAGQLWFLFPSDNQVYTFDRDKELFINIKSIFPDKTDFISSNFNVINTDNKGNVWFGTQNAGFYVYSVFTKQLLHFTRADGLCNNHINAFTFADQGDTWIGTENGLSRFNLQKRTFQNYSVLDGLPENEITGEGCFDSTTSTLYICNNFNLVFFNPSKLTGDKTPSPVFITSILVNNQERMSIADSILTLNNSENNITLTFTAINFVNAKNDQFDYYLEGLEKSWINSGQRTTVNYSNLSPGHYAFHVKAVNNFGIENAKEVVKRFDISIPFWRSWWFALLCLSLISATIYFINKFQLNRLVEMQKVRTRIARDLHDDMGSTLSSISILSEMAKGKVKNDPVKTTELIGRISENSQNMMDTMDDIVWSINPENDSVHHIIARMREFASSVFEAKNIELKFIADEKVKELKLTLDMRRDFFLIFKEAVNNLAKYSKCKNAVVELQVNKNNLLLRITDDGIGFDVSKLNSGNGLINMKRRAENLKGKCSIISSPGKGVAIEVNIPIT